MSILHRFLDLLFPTCCSFCRSPIADSPVPRFCTDCWSDFALIPAPVCARCGAPFPSPEALSHSPEHECLSCRKDTPHFDQALSIGQFEGPLREAVHQFKYRPVQALGRPLGAWMAEGVRFRRAFDVVVPVPLYRKRLRKRGFNQSLLLAYRVGEAFRVGLSCDNLVRVRDTVPQVELSGQDRIRNVKGAFALRRPEEVDGKALLIVDDVFTTGATLNECARVMKDAGASYVAALTLARTL